ncbi:glycosyltransferase [Thiosulfativibrio zosterae]|uniref:Glycosyl transferase n=1 Tax=Thiosulfativibrio zosterae TaxID=2675053 RepID=A0A6F8PM25_9GAMM|nr:glycosyltransferase [Thiosulfativibrio zosterae]BBP43159.1 glycosyl transferase [Thiosulfativibrio zosterae]
MTTLLAEKVLIIGYVWPEPNSSAAGTRMMQLIHSLQAQACEICFASPAKPGEHQFDLHSLGIQQQEILLNDSSFDDFLRQFQPGLVIFDRFMMEEQFGWRVEKHCPNALRILNTEDLHSLREVRQQMLKDAVKEDALGHHLQPALCQDSMTLFNKMSGSDLAIREISAILRCDLTLMISAFETNLLQTAFNLAPQLLFTLPFIYPDASPNSKPSFENRQHFICIGNFRHAPNWDAVLTLKHIWPQIRQALPNAELHIYGAYPPKKATELHNAKQGFYVKGWADDALTVVKSAKVMLAPLRFGAGIKGKLAEAMLCGTPSVTTPLGAESMCQSIEEWNGAVVDSLDAFVEQAIALYQNPEIWQAAQLKGDALFEAQFAKKSFYEQALFERIQVLQNHLTEERKRNFTGKMLRHHLHKSTQYMAQWIEAKNKLPPAQTPNTDP